MSSQPFCSKGQIGALQAESFCERVFSIAKGVINDGNVGLDDDYIDKVTTLRANERFMKFMKQNHHDEVFAVAVDNGSSKSLEPPVIVDEDGEDDFEPYGVDEEM